MAYTTYYDFLIGQKVGRLTVLENTHNVDRDNRTLYKCKCDCGNTLDVPGKRLKDGSTRSCGCLQRDKVIQKNYKHGLSYTKICNIWREMKRRCYDPKRKNYVNYGGRGIKVCDEWLDKENGFINFHNWAMSTGYRDDLTIERIDVNGNYCPENCKWISPKEQAYNKTNTIRTLDGYSAAKWSVEHGLDVRKVRDNNKDIPNITLYELHRRYFDYPEVPCSPDLL